MSSIKNTDTRMDNNHIVSIPDAYRVAHKHYAADRLDLASHVCRKVLDAVPGHPRSLHLLGLVQYKQGAFEEAHELLGQATRGRPSLAHFHNDLGASLSALGRHAEALATYQQAERLVDTNNTPTLMNVLRNIAIALQHVGRIDEAMEYHIRMLRLAPGDIETIWNRSHIYLAHGHFLQGWAGYEARLELKDRLKEFARHRKSRPFWDGLPFKGKKLLIWDEQGIGDMMQFIRFAPLVKALGGTVVVEMRHRLIRLFSSADGFDEVISRREAARRRSEFDLFIPMMSLPGVLEIRDHNLPAKVPYLHAEPRRVTRWKERLAGDDKLKVGLVWTGNADNKSMWHRSIKLAQLLPWLDVSGISLYSLQFGASKEELADIPENMELTHLGEDIAKFEELAAATENLDLIITVDTAMAHLAGALGRPVWVMLAFPTDWRWRLERENSPWYPTLRLFRQEQTGEWEPVLNRVQNELRKLAESR